MGEDNTVQLNQFVRKITSVYSKILGSLGLLEGSQPHLTLLVNLLLHLSVCPELEDSVKLGIERADEYKKRLRTISKKTVNRRVQDNLTPQGDNLDLLITSFDDLATRLDIPIDCIMFMEYKANFISGLIQELRRAYIVAEFPTNHYAEKEAKLESLKLDLTKAIAFMYGNATISD